MARFVQSSIQGYFISKYLERFSFMNEWTFPTPVLLSNLGGFPFSGCGWSMAMRVFQVGTIVCVLSNIPPVSSYVAEATILCSVWQTVRMGPFSFGLGVSVGGGLSLR